MPTPEGRFAALLAADGTRPFVTYYDERTGERTELSVRSLANWVAKTHHLLVDELGLGVGDTALVALPAHWISVPVVLGCLTAGLALSPDDTTAAVAFVTPDTAEAADGVLDVYAIAPDAAAAGLGDGAPAGTTDYVTAVRPQADAWPGAALPAGPDDPCLPGLTRAAADSDATARAAALGLAEGGRLLTTRGWRTAADWLDAVFAPLAVGGSVVIVRTTSDAASDNGAIVERRASQERATARLS